MQKKQHAQVLSSPKLIYNVPFGTVSQNIPILFYRFILSKKAITFSVYSPSFSISSIVL